MKTARHLQYQLKMLQSNMLALGVDEPQAEGHAPDLKPSGLAEDFNRLLICSTLYSWGSAQR